MGFSSKNVFACIFKYLSELLKRTSGFIPETEGIWFLMLEHGPS